MIFERDSPSFKAERNASRASHSFEVLLIRRAFCRYWFLRHHKAGKEENEIVKVNELFAIKLGKD